MKAPIGLVNKVGKLAMRRGKAVPGEDVKLWSFDAIQNCTMDDCPAYNDCPYKSRGDKCGVELSYIRSLWGMIYDNFSERFTEPFLFRVGMHMIPLYKGLCRMKLEEMGVNKIVYTTVSGDFKIHPIYSEIRRQMEFINKEWSKLGMDKDLLPTPEMEVQNAN